MAKRTKDFFYKKAKESGAVARSYFKIEDLDQKYKLIKPAMRVMDIGAAPGSWVQYIVKKIGDAGFVLAMDLNPLVISTPDNVVFLQQDIFELEPEKILETYGMFDLIISDVAPRTMGHQTVDHTRSVELCKHVLKIANVTLKKKSTMLCKMYQGDQTKYFVDRMKKTFSNVRIQKPEASRKESKEIYIIGEKS
jgi:23S rRNA (uridine2552-2'-O)-methyltransferase